MKKIQLSSLCIPAALFVKGEDFEVGEFGHSPTSEYIPRFIHTIPSEVHAFHPSDRVGMPADIARICLFLCEPESDFINGQTLIVDGGATDKMIYPE